MGGEADWLTFSVEALDGPRAMKLGDPPVVEPFTLESARMGTRTVDIAPYFDLGRPGRYAVLATVKIKEWGEELTSRPAMIDVSQGTKLWEQEIGVPVANGAPEPRKYMLQQANYKKHLQLYVRVSDPDEAQVFRVFPIGLLVSFSQPEAQVDRQSLLHVLFQTGAKAFAYTVVNPDGEVVVRQTHEYAGSRPMLKKSADGKISVAGGARHFTSADIPPSNVMGASMTNQPVIPPPPAEATPEKKKKDAKSKKK